MPSVDELLLNGIDTLDDEESFEETNKYCEIDETGRVIVLNDLAEILGVENDKAVERVYFRCPRYVGDNVDLDLKQCTVYINFQNANMDKDQYIVTDLNTDETDSTKVTFSWLLSKKVTQYKGIVNFIVCARKTKTGGEIEQEWNTTLARATVLEGLEPDPYAVPSDDMDVVNQLMDLVKQEIEQKGQETIDSIPDDYTELSSNVEAVRGQIGSLSEEIEEQKIVSMTSVNPYKIDLEKYNASITSGKYLTGRNTSEHVPTFTQQDDYNYDVIDIKINPNNTIVTVPYDAFQSVGQAFVLYTEGIQSNNATPDNVNKKQVGVIDVTPNSYTVNLNASHLNYARVAFTVPKGRRDFYFSSPDEGELGKLIDKKISISSEELISKNILIAPVNMFYSIGAIGDSYTAGSALSSDGKTWQDVTDLSWIATMGKRAGIYWSNYGKGGATTKSYITDELPDVLKGTAKDLYFIALGINDCLQKLPIGTISDIKSNYSENGKSFYGWYGSIIAQIQNHAPKAKIVLVKIWTDGTAKIPYDNAIDKIAKHFELPVINPFDDYFFNSSLYLNNMVSGHPTAMGYSSMGVAMERLFSRCVIENPDYFKYATIG